jgi:hypothetical protein
MNTTNKNSVAVAAIGAVFPLCLALTCLAGPAAATVVWGTANGPVTCNANGTCTSLTPVPVGPGPGGGGTPINPNDYGMCGLLHLAGTFENSTVARIVVAADGYYAVERSWVGKPTEGPVVEWTCVRFTDFTGLPPISDAGSFAAPVVTASGGAMDAKKIGGIGDACIWAGLAGGLSSANQAISVSAQYNVFDTLDSAQSAPGTKDSTYAFCSTFKGFSFHHYYFGSAQPGNGSTSGLPVALIFNPEHAWCYMGGAGSAAGGAFTSAGLGVLGTGTYAFDVAKDSHLWFNCMSLSQ